MNVPIRDSDHDPSVPAGLNFLGVDVEGLPVFHLNPPREPTIPVTDAMVERAALAFFAARDRTLKESIRAALEAALR